MEDQERRGGPASSYGRVILNNNKREENLYEFENRSENIQEKLSQKKMENLVCLQVDQKNKNGR